MTEEDAFLKTIRAAPDDDLPRLVYADYLDERGDPDRAEFIRVQCADARGASGRTSLRHRAAALLHGHYRTWIPGLRADVTPTIQPDGWVYLRTNGRGEGESYSFTRGFITHVRLRVGTFAGRGAVGGSGKQLAAGHDLRKVYLLDRFPLLADNGVAVWERYWKGYAEGEHALPGKLFDRLDGRVEYVDSDMCLAIMRHPNLQGAVDAASDAAIRWAFGLWPTERPEAG